MNIRQIAQTLRAYAQKILEVSGFSLIVEPILNENNSIIIRVRTYYRELAARAKVEQNYELKVFNDFYNDQNALVTELDLADKNQTITGSKQRYLIYEYQKRILKEINDLFVQEKKLYALYNQVQETNFSLINSVEIMNFFSIKKIHLPEMKGIKEIYFLGENGDGKSLVLMGIHLAFNGREAVRKTKLEFTGKVQDMLNENNNLKLNGIDKKGMKYGTGKYQYLKTFFAYGAHRGRYSTDAYEKYGFISLYDVNQQLYNPVELLKQTFIIELLQRSNLKEDLKTSYLPLIDIVNLFEALLENNVKIEPHINGVTFREKGYPIEFDKLSEGYRNLLIWVSDMIYRFQEYQPGTKALNEFNGVVIVDEIELHLHLIWQRRLIGLLRQFFPNIQFIFTTHSPTIVQGASEDAIFYRISRDDKTGATSASQAYYKANLDHLMLNTLVTSPLFGLDDARVSSTTEDVDTSNDFVQSRIRQKVDAAILLKKEAGGPHLNEAEIDSIIDEILNGEML